MLKFILSIRNLVMIILICFPNISNAALTIATYPGMMDERESYCAAQLRLALFELRGTDWYIDNVLFNNRIITQLFILDHGYIGIGTETPHNYREGVDVVSAIKDAVDYMSEKNDTLYFPNDEWDMKNTRKVSDEDYSLNDESQIMYNANGFIYTGHRAPFFVEYGQTIFRRITKDANPPTYSYTPSVLLWTVILQSPFSESTIEDPDYQAYTDFCNYNGMNPLPRITNGMEKSKYTYQEILYYLEFALTHDRMLINKGMKDNHKEPFDYINTNKRPTVRLEIKPKDLNCRNIFLNIRNSLVGI